MARLVYNILMLALLLGVNRMQRLAEEARRKGLQSARCGKNPPPTMTREVLIIFLPEGTLGLVAIKTRGVGVPSTVSVLIISSWVEALWTVVHVHRAVFLLSQTSRTAKVVE